jgi:hypothetical protein
MTRQVRLDLQEGQHWELLYSLETGEAGRTFTVAQNKRPGFLECYLHKCVRAEAVRRDKRLHNRGTRSQHNRSGRLDH